MYIYLFAFQQMSNDFSYQLFKLRAMKEQPLFFLNSLANTIDLLGKNLLIDTERVNVAMSELGGHHTTTIIEAFGWNSKSVLFDLIISNRAHDTNF